MVTPVRMPKLSPGVTEAMVVEWVKREKEIVKKGEPILIVETEKVTIEIDAPSNGRLERILVQEGSRARSLEEVAIIS